MASGAQRVNMGYAVGQLLAAQASHGPTAPKKVRQWLSVLEGAQDGTLSVGSRAPVKDTPSWLTLEVVHGGFATGGLSAGGSLLPFEEGLLASTPESAPLHQSAPLNRSTTFEQSAPMPDTIMEDAEKGTQAQGMPTPAANATTPEPNAPTSGPSAPTSEPSEPTPAQKRLRLNTWYLSGGWSQLEGMLQSGRFRLQHPEEAAFLTLVWLVRRGEEERAGELFHQLSPFLYSVRFYPQPLPATPTQPESNESSLSPQPGAPSLASGSAMSVEGGTPAEAGQEGASGLCFVHPVKEAVRRLRALKPDKMVATQQEALAVWVPLKDKLADLILETVAGEAPSFQRDEGGRWVRDSKTQIPQVVGGWPGQQIPGGYLERAAVLLAECDRLPMAYTRAVAEREKRLKALAGAEETSAENERRRAYMYPWRAATSPQPVKTEDTSRRVPSKSKAADYLKLLNFLWKLTAGVQRGEGGAGGDKGRIAGLTGREVGAVRRVLAAHREKHGAPGSAKRVATRRTQAQHLAAPLPSHVALIVARRLLSAYPDPETGAPEVQRCLGPLSPQEASLLLLHFQCRQGAPLSLPLAPFPTSESGRSPCGCTNLPTSASLRIPNRVSQSATCCLAAPLETLLACGLVPSAEVLAATLPQLTADCVAAGVPDRELRRVYQRLYCAFRARRSLLLLNLESQVRFGELPWVQAVTPWVGHTEAQGVVASLAKAARLAIESWPQTMLPNPLVKELQFLVGESKGALGKLPLVEELAADIFEGQFVAKFLRAAQAAGGVLKGTLYERYYGLNYGKILALRDLTAKKSYSEMYAEVEEEEGKDEEGEEEEEATEEGGEKEGGAKDMEEEEGKEEEARSQGKLVSPGFLRECKRLAGAAPRSRSRWPSAAENGAILEQAQILTTHNLAPLVCHGQLGLRGQLDFWGLAQRCFRWVCHRYAGMAAAKERATWRDKLHLKKNGAYAWRNMILFLSLLESAQKGGGGAPKPEAQEDASEGAQEASLAAGQAGGGTEVEGMEGAGAVGVREAGGGGGDERRGVQEFILWAEQHLKAEVPPAAAAVLGPYFQGLKGVVAGERFDRSGVSESGVRYLGWKKDSASLTKSDE